MSIKTTKAWRSANKEYVSQTNKEYYLDNKQAIKIRTNNNIHIRRYGISLEQKEQIFKEQGSCCAICKTTDPNSQKGWHTDHDHKTLRVRGVVCQPCNYKIGCLEKLIENNLLEKVFDYIK